MRSARRFWLAVFCFVLGAPLFVVGALTHFSQPRFTTTTIAQSNQAGSAILHATGSVILFTYKLPDKIEVGAPVIVSERISTIRNHPQFSRSVRDWYDLTNHKLKTEGDCIAQEILGSQPGAALKWTVVGTREGHCTLTFHSRLPDSRVTLPVYFKPIASDATSITVALIGAAGVIAGALIGLTGVVVTVRRQQEPKDTGPRIIRP